MNKKPNNQDLLKPGNSDAVLSNLLHLQNRNFFVPGFALDANDYRCNGWVKDERSLERA